MEQQNKWEKLFEEFMDLTEFSLIKHRNPEHVVEYEAPDGDPICAVDYCGYWSIYDRQGANLGNINEDRFDNAGQILDRMEIYINDYIYRDLEEELDAYQVDLENHELPWNADMWLALRDDKDFYEKNKDYFDEHKWEFDILDMIANHFDEIDLENVYHEEEN